MSVTFQEFGFLSFLSYYDSNGKKQWQKSPDQFPGLSQEVAIDQDGNVFVAGGNSLVVKYLGSNGEISWQHQDSFPSFFGGIALDRSGNPVVSSGLPIRPPKHRYDFPKYAFETIKFDGNSGSVLWQKRELNAVFAQPSSVAVEAGVVAVTGNAGGDAITIKYADGPTPHTLSAEILGESSARLTGEVTPNLFSTDAAFLFGTDPALEGASITEYTTIGSGRDAVRVGATIGLLQPGQTYYFCVVGQPKDGLTIKGDIRKFSTPAFR